MKITAYGDHEEFFARFVRVEGKRGTVLIFRDSEESDDRKLKIELAKEIGEVLDRSEERG